MHDQGAAAAEADRLGDGFDAVVAEDLQRGRVTRELSRGSIGPVARVNFSPNWLVSCWASALL